MNKVGIVACSNGQSPEYKALNNELIEWLQSIGDQVICSSCIYENNFATPGSSINANNSIFPGSIRERAAELMKMFADEQIREIYDISGGDIANQILDALDYERIRQSKAVFWGYSDLTTIINAIYTMTGKSSVLYQVKNMVWGEYPQLQRDRFLHRENLFNPSFEFLQGQKMEGIVVGGNIRCFLKLAGTKYFPDLQDKILLLEALGGETPQIATYLAQLQQLGAFEQIGGILLGTFTTFEKSGGNIYNLVREYAGNLPIARTHEIGHGKDSKAIRIGEEISLSES